MADDAAPRHRRSFMADFEATGKAMLTLRVNVTEVHAPATAPGTSAADVPAPAPKPACVLTGEFVAVHYPTYKRAAAAP